MTALKDDKELSATFLGILVVAIYDNVFVRYIKASIGQAAQEGKSIIVRPAISHTCFEISIHYSGC